MSEIKCKLDRCLMRDGVCASINECYGGIGAEEPRRAPVIEAGQTLLETATRETARLTGCGRLNTANCDVARREGSKASCACLNVSRTILKMMNQSYFEAGFDPSFFELTHRHRKRGSLYRIAGHFEVQDSADGAGLHEGDVVVGYISEEGKGWCRKKDEFYDGRFEDLTIADCLPERDS